MKKIYLTICGLLSLTLIFGQSLTQLDESFETVNGATYVPDGWISVDDGDAYPWRQLSDGKARTGAAYVGTGGYSGGGSPSNDWLITPKLLKRGSSKDD